MHQIRQRISLKKKAHGKQHLHRKREVGMVVRWEIDDAMMLDEDLWGCQVIREGVPLMAPGWNETVNEDHRADQADYYGRCNAQPAWLRSVSNILCCVYR